jgi:hypothetical protein
VAYHRHVHADGLFGGAAVDRHAHSAMWMQDYEGRDMPSITYVVLMTLFTPAVVVFAATVEVDCSAGGVVARVLGNVKPGDALVISGICRENIVIEPEIQRITIDGQGKATVQAPDAVNPRFRSWAGRSRSKVLP